MKNDGGPAFPRTLLLSECRGMSLRDWYAGQALRSLSNWSDSKNNAQEAVAKACYDYADAMLKEREK